MKKSILLFLISLFYLSNQIGMEKELAIQEKQPLATKTNNSGRVPTLVSLAAVQVAKELKKPEFLETFYEDESSFDNLILPDHLQSEIAKHVPNSAYLWNTSKPISKKLTLEEDILRDIALNPDSSLISAALIEEIFIFSATTGKHLITLKGHRGHVISSEWNKDDSLFASLSLDNTIRIWNPHVGYCMQVLKHERLSKAYPYPKILSFAWNHNGTFLASSDDVHTVRLCNLKTGEYMPPIWCENRNIHAVKWNHNSTLLAIASHNQEHVQGPVLNNVVDILVIDSGKSSRVKISKRNKITGIEWAHHSNRLAIGTNGDYMYLWDFDVKKLIKKRTMLNPKLLWNPDDSIIAIISGSMNQNTIELWNPDTGDCIRTLKYDDKTIQSLSWNSNGTQLFSLEELTNKICIWSIDDTIKQTLKNSLRWFARKNHRKNQK